MAERRPIVGGNWKMHTNRQTGRSLAGEVAQGLAGLETVDVVVFPPFPYLLPVAEVLAEHGGRVKLGAQDLYHEPEGAFTGEVSASMLLDCGAEYVLIGHSERRHVLGEDDTTVNIKLLAALEAGLWPVLCIGETLEQREAGRTDEVNERQLRAGLRGVGPDQADRLTIAYEPVWAIGTGKTATPEDAQAAQHRARGVIGDLLGSGVAETIPIQYGGSVKGANAADLFTRPDVDGGLVGGASLKGEEFVAICRAAAERGRGD